MSASMRTFLSLILALATHTATAAERPDLIRSTRFEAHLLKGQGYQRSIGTGLVLTFVPDECGWHLDMREQGSHYVNDFGLASIATPPLHGPTALDIEGWQFRNADNTGSNDGSVNAPQKNRDFSFVLTRTDAQKLADE